MWPALIPLLTGIFDKIFPNPDDANKAKIELMRLEQEGAFRQLDVNAVEAKHQSIFVAGWRPAVGWVCAIIFAYNFLIQPLLLIILEALGKPLTVLPSLDFEEVMTVLCGLLGISGLRTYEKIKGVQK
ncbi:3TM-type holin [Fluviispira vulneris]|uniref:3TM-type holin n=1 Tax=Fluviispira vulneris TaxID=2763012 RepID=UPI001647ED2C|nr:3TM-type holin [Fluviispira vulneris]